MRAAVLLIVLVALGACSGDDAGPPPDAHDPPDAAQAVCADPAPTSCEEVNQHAADCPTLEEICAGVCGAAYDCCFCGDDGTWQVEFTDCPPCEVDAGP